MTRSARALPPRGWVSESEASATAVIEAGQDDEPTINTGVDRRQLDRGHILQVLWRALAAASQSWPRWKEFNVVPRLMPIPLAAFVITAPIHAQAGAPPPPPPIDLGQTNILDAEGKPGGLLEIIAFGSFADQLTDGTGDDAPGRNHQRIASLVMHPIFVGKYSIFGAHPGFELLVPVTRVENDFAMGGGQRAGLGDVTISPFLQWSAAPKAGAVSVRLALQAVAPTGSYSSRRAVNTGQGAWQVSPYLAVTWRASDRWEVSARAIYDRTGSSTSSSPTGEPISVRPGDVFALNVSTSYAITDSVRLGPGGYVLQQVRESRSAGEPIAGSRARIFALGPVSRLQIGQATLLLAAFGEFAARNRPQGASVNLRFQHPF